MGDANMFPAPVVVHDHAGAKKIVAVEGVIVKAIS